MIETRHDLVVLPQYDVNLFAKTRMKMIIGSEMHANDYKQRHICYDENISIRDGSFLVPTLLLPF